MKTLHFKAHLLKIFKIFAKPKGGKIKFHYETKQNQAKNKKRFRQIHFVYLPKTRPKKAGLEARLIDIEIYRRNVYNCEYNLRHFLWQGVGRTRIWLCWHEVGFTPTYRFLLANKIDQFVNKLCCPIGGWRNLIYERGTIVAIMAWWSEKEEGGWFWADWAGPVGWYQQLSLVHK